MSRFNILLAALVMFSSPGLNGQPTNNVLSQAEKNGSWTLLFDGKDVSQWRGAYARDFPSKGWKIEGGELKGAFTSGMEAGDGGDIVTRELYRNFEMYFDWKLGAGGNSGVKYFVEERQPKPPGSQPGYEYQIIDDANYIYNGQHLTPKLKTASIYDVIAAKKPNTAIGSWHRSHIRVQGARIEHWLDGKKVVDVSRDSEIFRAGVSSSKFRDYAGFAQIPEGHILLQDHGHNVSFRNLKIRKLP